MNSYFSTIGEKLAKELPPPMTNGQQIIEEIANTMYEPPTLTEITVSTQSVRDKVNTLKINKFTGPYDTPQKLLRLAGTPLSLIWSGFIAVALSIKQFSPVGKQLSLRLFIKKDDECGNHCSVSLLQVPVFCEIIHHYQVDVFLHIEKISTDYLISSLWNRLALHGFSRLIWLSFLTY